MITIRATLPLALLFVLSCTSAAVTLPAADPAPAPAPQPAEAAARPKSIIFLIADGAGSAQFTVAQMRRGADFQTGRLPFTGLVSTSPVSDSVVTDSAAAATAYATGVRTNYRAVGVDPAGNPRTTVLEVAESRGKATGLVTTADFFDATPAAFAAHTKSRYEAETIVGQMLASGAELIVGGGATRFGVEGRPTLEQIADATGYTLIRRPADLPGASGERILAVFPTEKGEVDFAEIRLPALARWAIERLSPDPEGFFLLVEHEGTDGAAHANDTERFMDSLISFDEAVGVALEYATARGDVLVVVTGDHETGGLQIHRERGAAIELVWATKGHTGEAVPIFAYGPGAELFVGFLSGEEVGQRLLRLVR